jgi:GNAT superfamily N-acetyltransferase
VSGSELGQILDRAARGDFLAADGTVDVLPAPERVHAAVLSFSAHLVVATDIAAGEVHEIAPPGDFVAWGRVAPWLGQRYGRASMAGDVALAAIADGRSAPLDLELVDGYEHPRVAFAARFRADLQVYVTRDRSGVLVLGRGLGDRHELAFEVDPGARGRGLGRALIACALALVPEGEAVWAQVHPANAASLRPVLAAGLQPIGHEQLIA